MGNEFFRMGQINRMKIDFMDEREGRAPRANPERKNRRL